MAEATPFSIALVQSRQTILNSTFTVFESNVNLSPPHNQRQQSLETVLLDPVATLLIGPHQFHGTKLFVINRANRAGIQFDGLDDASTSMHTQQVSASIIIQFSEAPQDKYILPDHFTCTVLQSSSSTTKRLLLSFFVFIRMEDSTTVGGKGKELEGGKEDSEIPVPIDIVVEGVDAEVADVILSAGNKPRDEATERWWLKMIASVPSRPSMIKGVEVPPALIESPPFSPSAAHERNAGLELTAEGPSVAVRSKRPSLVPSSRSSSPVGPLVKKRGRGKGVKTLAKSNLGTSSLPPSPGGEMDSSAQLKKSLRRSLSRKAIEAAAEASASDDGTVARKRRGRGKARPKVKVEEHIIRVDGTFDS